MNDSLTGLEPHEGKWFSILGKLTKKMWDCLGKNGRKKMWKGFSSLAFKYRVLNIIAQILQNYLFSWLLHRGWKKKKSPGFFKFIMHPLLFYIIVDYSSGMSYQCSLSCGSFRMVNATHFLKEVKWDDHTLKMIFHFWPLSLCNTET